VDFSTNGQLVRRAMEELRGTMSTQDASPADLRSIQDKLDERYYDHPKVRTELADRLGGMLGLSGQ